MNWFLAGWVLVLQTGFWGLGLTLLLLPGRWRRFWPAFVAPVGLALQSAVVWAGAHTTLPGTDSYALASLLLPVGLLAGAFRRFGGRNTVAHLAAVRRWWVLLPIVSVSFALQIAPFTKPPALFTVLTLGSCDAADYATGARVFKEFSSRDRTGFLGQPEQVRDLSVDNFYEFWLRINHFTPSAVLALDASLLRRQPYELTSLLGIVLVGITLPLVFWLGRSLFGFRPAAAAGIALVYGCSPVILYAVYQVALGQLLAAPAVAIVLWTGLQADRAVRRGERPRKLWAYFGLLMTGNWLLFGGYNFFVVFAYVPLVAFVGGRTFWQRGGWAAAGRLAGFIAVNFLACAICFPERVIGIVERFLLFNKTPFGWKIAPFRPDGWYGAFGDAYLRPGPAWSLALGIVCLLALGVAAWHLVRTGRERTVALAAACALPVLCGYGILTWEELAKVRQNASYDAYKLFTVFYPLALPSLCLWLAVGWRRVAPVWARAGTALLALVLFALNLQGGWRYNKILRSSASTISPGMSELAALDQNPGVSGGINIHLKTLWDALWAGQFLLHQRQYFVYPIYEGRAVTAPYGRWNLDERYIAPEPANGAPDPLATDVEFALVDRENTGFIETRFLGDWYEPERYRGNRWCWAGPSPEIAVVNAHPATVDTLLTLNLCGVGPRQLRLFAGKTLVWEGKIDRKPQAFPPVPLRLPPGETRLRFEMNAPPERPPGDTRVLSFALYGWRIRPLSPPAEPSHP